MSQASVTITLNCIKRKTDIDNLNNGSTITVIVDLWSPGAMELCAPVTKIV